MHAWTKKIKVGDTIQFKSTHEIKKLYNGWNGMKWGIPEKNALKYAGTWHIATKVAINGRHSVFGTHTIEIENDWAIWPQQIFEPFDLIEKIRLLG